MLTPVIILNSSPATWDAVPLPADAMLILPGIGLGVSDELGNRLGRNRWIHHHDVGTRMMLATGAMSRMKLKLSLS